MENILPSNSALATKANSSSSATSQAHEHTVSSLAELSKIEVVSETQLPSESMPESRSNIWTIFELAGTFRRNPSLISSAPMSPLISLARHFVSAIDNYEDVLWGNLHCMKYYHKCIPSLEARLRLMRRLDNVKEEEKDLKETKDRLRTTVANLERECRKNEDYVLLRAAVRDMIGEVQRRLRGDMEETERNEAEEALTMWKTELKARDEVKHRERSALEQERAPIDHIPDIDIAAEAVEIMRESLVRRFWLRLDYVD